MNAIFVFLKEWPEYGWRDQMVPNGPHQAKAWTKLDGFGPLNAKIQFGISQGQKSAQGILRLRNPNSGPNSGKRI